MAIRRTSIRDLHRAAVLRLLRERGPTSRAELAAATGLSRPTMSVIVGELLAEGALAPVAAGSEAGAVGRPAGLVDLAPPTGRALGVEIGRAQIRALVAGAAGQIEAERSVVPAHPESLPDLLETARGVLADLAAAADLRARPAPAMIGVPWPVGLHGEALGRHPEQVDLVTALSLADLVTTVGVRNEVDLAALGELAFGAARGLSNVIVVKQSYGVGAGLILGGRLYRGQGYAGDLGHVRVLDAGPVCVCGGRGCLETVVSLRAMLAALSQAHGDRVTTVADLVALAEADDLGVRGLVTDAGRTVGRALADAITLLSPQAVIVGTDLPALQEPLLAGLSESLARYVQPAVRDTLIVSPPDCGPRSAALGAVALAMGLVEEAQ